MGNDGHNGQTPGTDVSDQPQQASESLTGKLWAGCGGWRPLIGQYQSRDLNTGLSLAVCIWVFWMDGLD